MDLGRFVMKCACEMQCTGQQVRVETARAFDEWEAHQDAAIAEALAA